MVSVFYEGSLGQPLKRVLQIDAAQEEALVTLIALLILGFACKPRIDAHKPSVLIRRVERSV